MDDEYLRNYIRGHLYDIASEEKIQEEDTDVPEIIDEVMNLKGNFNQSSELQKAVLGVLSKYSSREVKREELVTVSRKIANNIL